MASSRTDEGAVSASPQPDSRRLRRNRQRRPGWELPRDKLLRCGATALSEAELFAVLFGTGHRGASALDVATAVLHRFGSVSALMHADQHAFCTVQGLGTARYAQWMAAVELCRRSVGESLRESSVLQSPDQVRHYLSHQLAGLEHEEFAALMLDNRHRVIAYRALFRGTIDGAAVYPREVVKLCLGANAAAVIFAHNHPSGVPEPSDADISITRKLVEALSLIDVRVLDHLIVGQGVQCSLAERGLM